MEEYRVIRCNSENPHFVSLVHELTEFLAVHNGEKDSFYTQFNTIESIAHAVVAMSGDVAVGCGAFRPKDDATVEIKRMFVQPTVRRSGVGALILADLEDWARTLGYSSAILETSKGLGPAVRLYQRNGYTLIPNYEPYIGVEDSVCLSKSLV